MASADSHMIGKRRHVETERMKEFRAVEEESKDKKRKCPVEGCNKFFTSKPGLRYHMQTHSPTKTFFKCPVCKRCFQSQNGLKYHNKDKKDSCKKPLKSPKQDPDPGGVVKDTTGPDNPTPQQVNLPFSHNDNNRLRDLAIIATGPQSPLLQTREQSSRCGEQNQVLDLSRKSTITAKESTLATRVRPPPLPSSPTIDSTSGHKFHSWPTVVWQCFLTGTRLNFSESVSGDQWITAEVLAEQERLRNIASYVQATHHNASNSDVGIKITDIKIQNNSVTLFFTMNETTCTPAVAQCSIDHPFFVKDKGWCSCATQQTSDHYGIPCQKLEVNDLCLPPSHPEATYSKVYDSIPFTPMDSDAAMALSSMAQKKNQDSPKAKRPMNGFMLFAQKKRLEYTQKHPGKDNRAISKLLGEEWKTLEVKNKEKYKEEAKKLSKEKVKLFPDCWKRKR